MRSFINVFRFEFANYVKSKSFILITFLFVTVVGISLSFPHITAFFASDSSDVEKPVIAVSGLSNEEELTVLREALPDNRLELTTKSPEELEGDVEAGTYTSAIIITGDLSYQYIVKNIGMLDNTKYVLDEVMKSSYQAQVLAELGADATDISEFIAPQVNGEVKKTADGKDQMQNFFYTYVLMFGLYMAILLYGQFVAMGVASEKSSRAMELLVTSIKPNQLMFGKVLGTGLAGLLQFAAIIGSGYIFYNINKDLYYDNEIIQSIFNMPVDILIYALLFFILGFFIYAFLYGALASMVSRIEQLNTSTMPVTFTFIISFMIIMFSMGFGNTDSVLIKAASFVPLTSPMAMFVRIAMGTVASWEIALSVGLLLAGTIGIGVLAAGIFRIGVLLYGQPPKLKEIFALMKKTGD